MDFGFNNQVTRIGLSFSSNITEGSESETDKERANFLYHSKGSAEELKTQTYIGMDVGYIDKEIGIGWI